MALALDLRILFIVFSTESPYTRAELEQLLFFNFDLLVLVFSPLIERND